MIRRAILGLCCLTPLTAPLLAQPQEPATQVLRWRSLPDLPGALGVGGPFVGVHRDALIVAGGANAHLAPGRNLQEATEVLHDEAWVLIRQPNGTYRWLRGFKLDQPVAYGACVSTRWGIACLGGSGGADALPDCFLLSWDPREKQLGQTPLPPLPQPCAHGAAAAIDGVIYLAGGQKGAGIETAMSNFWRLDLSKLEGPATQLLWEKLPAWPGPSRTLNLTVAQHNGFDDCIYVISGRRQATGGEAAVGLTDVYEFNPRHYDPRAFDPDTGRYAGAGRLAAPWRKRADVPRCVMAGTAAPIGQAHLFVLSGTNEKLSGGEAEVEEQTPGLPSTALAYHTITDTWIEAGAIPANQVVTPATTWDGKIILASGQVRPQAWSRAVWAIEPVSTRPAFGAINFAVLTVYLLGMVALGVYFSRKNRDTDDYFRGGQKIAWWVAGCSIFATMLSSITYMSIPAKAYAQDLVYLVGNMMILAVAPIAIYLALPFFRYIDVTSAYEYLEQRFHRPVRLFASALFTMFHVFRMGIVMSLAALALATVTPLTACQCVLIMGALSIVYCTLGGVGAVVWTDTIQTFVLLGGAVLCFGLMIAGAGGFGSLLHAAADQGKLHLLNLHWDFTSASLALWVVILGAIGQNVSSYTADQAVVQRYMTTPDIRRAARSIWIAASLAIPASLLFFLLGTGLWMFYRSHPHQLDPTFMTDQIFPLFISHEVPVGVAGLIVAGIFAAAQSTISTSMNSTATAAVTDFLRPFDALKTERGYFNWARGLTFAFGAAGTLLGLLFVDPQIKSLFDQFIKVIGLFMGVLGGLFGLGVLTRRANGPGTLVGAISGAAVVLLVERFTRINGYLYAAIGIAGCFLIGYLASLVIRVPSKDLTGLTIYTRRPLPTTSTAVSVKGS